MQISLIAAMSENGVIGNQNKLPWHVPEELKYFKKTTLGKAIVMGRKTFEALNSKPLPDRQNIILTHDKNFSAPGCSIAHSPDSAIALAKPSTELMVIGGAQVFELFLPYATRIYLSIIHQDCAGDTYFPKLDWEHWIKIAQTGHVGFTAQVFERASTAAPARL